MWRLANGAGAMLHLGGGVRLALDAMQGETSLRWVRSVSACGFIAGALSLASAAGFLPHVGNFIFLLATSWALCVAVISFLSLLMSARAPSEPSADVQGARMALESDAGPERLVKPL